MNFRLTDVPEILSAMGACVNYRRGLAGAWNHANEHYAAAVICENIFMTRVRKPRKLQVLSIIRHYALTTFRLRHF